MKEKNDKEKRVHIGKIGFELFIIPAINIIWNCKGTFLAFAWLRTYCSILIF